MKRPTRDFLWKAALRMFIRPFVQFFYPFHYKKVDWTKSVEFLDKELHRIFANAKQKHRIADALVKLHLKNGKELWILLYAEVQGYSDAEFPKRIHQIRYRIEELFGQNPAILAIYTDDDPDFHPKKYRLNTWGAVSETQFTTYKVMNHPPSTYADPQNPIALIMKVVYWATRPKKLDDNTLMELHFEVVRELLANNYSKYEVGVLLDFIKNYVRFGNKKIYPIFDLKIDNMLKYETTEEILAYYDYESRYKSIALDFERMEAAKQRVEVEIQQKEAERQRIEAEKQQAEAEKQQAEAEKQQAEAEKQQAEAEKQQAEAEKRQAEWRLERSVLNLIARGMDRSMIADVMLISLDEIRFIEEKYAQDSDNLTEK